MYWYWLLILKVLSFLFLVDLVPEIACLWLWVYNLNYSIKSDYSWHTYKNVII
jgi:hypothetical protein